MSLQDRRCSNRSRGRTPRRCRAVQKSRIMQNLRAIDMTGLFLCISHRHKSGMIYGYARVSTDGQSVAAQVTALNAAGAGKVFREVASGAKTDRAQLRKAIAALHAGDVLMAAPGRFWLRSPLPGTPSRRRPRSGRPPVPPRSGRRSIPVHTRRSCPTYGVNLCKGKGQSYQ